MPGQPSKSDVHINAPLTNISIAYIQEQSKFVADKIFPMIPVQKQSDRYFMYKKGNFFRAQAQKRAPGTESAGSGFEIDNTPTYYADVWALHQDIDDQTRQNADSPLSLDRDSTIFLTQQGLLTREKEWVDSYFKAGVWDTDLVGGVGFTLWDDASSTPIEDVQGQALTIGRKTGFKPNTLVLSPDVFNALRNHADILDRVKYTQRGVVTTDLLAAIFDVDRVVVPESVVNSAPEGVADSLDYFLGKHAFLCYSNPRPSIMTPSAGYMFSWNGLLGAGAAGNRISRFRMEHLKADRVEIEMAFDMKVVGSDLGVFFSGAVS